MKNQFHLYYNFRMTLPEYCNRCIYSTATPGVSLSQSGVCNICLQIENLASDYATGKTEGEEKLRSVVEKVKKQGRRNKYDCIIGVSGGTDSSFLLHLSKIWGLRPLAVHYDNTWNTAAATMNISKLLKKLDFDLHTHVLNNREADSIFRAFFLAGVPEIDASTDLGIAYVLRKVAQKYGIKYIFEGHSFITEGITPLNRNYFDGKYIQTICNQEGVSKFETYPLMTMRRFLISTIFYRTRIIRPFWYLDYSKENARKILEKNYDWQYYNGHHLENKMSAFYHSIYLPYKFNVDMRENSLAARVRRGSLSREDALTEYKTKQNRDTALETYFQKRLNFTQNEYEQVMNASTHNWREFATYKKTFERMKPIFYVLSKMNIVTTSFYLKYCFPNE